MTGLSSGLNIGLSGLQASQAALDVIGHNISNVNTPGYSRQDVALSSSASQSFGNLQYGTGVTVSSITATRNKFLDMQITSGLSGQAGAQTRYDGIQAVASAFTDDGTTGLATQIHAFFAGMQQLAAAPQDSSMRANLVGTAQSMVQAFKSRYQMVSDQITSSDQQVGSLVTQVNTLTTQIAALNVRISGESKPGADSDARDQRAALADQLGKLVGVSMYEDDKSRLQVTLDNGAGVLVSGGNTNQLGTQPSGVAGAPADVVVTNSTSTTIVTRQIKNGAMGGMLDLRDTILPGFQAKLDQLAAGLSGQVNALTRAGFDANGANTTIDLFQGGPANVVVAGQPLPPGINNTNKYKGMVSALAVNATIVADPKLIPAGLTSAAGDNGTILAIGKLESSTATVDTNNDGTGDSGPFATTVAIINNAVGTAAQGFQSTVTNLENLNTALSAQRSNASAVSLDEEAAKLLAFQRGYQASARFINVISQLTDELVNQLGR
jgi:flagellar hook-associated protein 1 FlgK